MLAKIEISAGLGTGSGNAGILQLQASSEKSASGRSFIQLLCYFKSATLIQHHVGTTGFLVALRTLTLTELQQGQERRPRRLRIH